MAQTQANDRISKIANGIAAVLDATGLFASGTPHETRYWQSGLPGYMLWWDGFEAVGPASQPSQSLEPANNLTRARFNLTVAVRLDGDEQAAQEQLRSLVCATVNALWVDKTLQGTSLRSAAPNGQNRVRLEDENKALESTITVLADFGGSWV